MAFIKCAGCGREIQSSSSKCMYCGFDLENWQTDGNIKLIAQEPNILPIGDESFSIYNRDTGELIAELKFGDVFYMQIAEPITIEVRKAAWKMAHRTLFAKPNATYKILFKNGWLTSKIQIKDITNIANEQAKKLRNATLATQNDEQEQKAVEQNGKQSGQEETQDEKTVEQPKEQNAQTENPYTQSAESNKKQDA